MNTNLDLATDKLSVWRARLGKLLSKPERQLINQFLQDAKNSDDPGMILTPELKAAIQKVKADKKAVALLKEALKLFALADVYDKENSLYPKRALDSFRRKAYAMLCGGE